MKIGIIGASGKAGSMILKEATDRGHEVTAIVRNAAKLTNQAVPNIEKDIFDLTTKDLQLFDVVVNAFGAPLGEEQAHVDAGRTLIEVLKGTDTKLIVVGGAGSLYVDEDKKTQLIDTPDFPDEAKPTSRGQSRNLADLQKSTDLTWTFISPAIMFDPEGVRTGSYQTGKDQLIFNSENDSYISYADYAIAVVDEIENPKHINERFAVVAEKITK